MRHLPPFAKGGKWRMNCKLEFGKLVTLQAFSPRSGEENKQSGLPALSNFETYVLQKIVLWSKAPLSVRSQCRSKNSAGRIADQHCSCFYIGTLTITYVSRTVIGAQGEFGIDSIWSNQDYMGSATSFCICTGIKLV